MSADRLPTLTAAATPTEAVERLIRLHRGGRGAAAALERFFDGAPRRTPRSGAIPLPRAARRLTAGRAGSAHQPPTPSSRPPASTPPRSRSRAFRAYLLEQLAPLVRDYGATHRSRHQRAGNPLSLRLEPATSSARRGLRRRTRQLFPDAAARRRRRRDRGRPWEQDADEPRPLALFDAMRVDYSLRRLVHYTGSDWRHVQPWILLTNYHRYVDQFVRYGMERLLGADGLRALDPAGRRPSIGAAARARSRAR